MSVETVTLDQARLKAHEAALRTDAAYRAYWDRSEAEKLAARAHAEARRQAIRSARSRRTHYVAGTVTGLPTLRVACWLRGRVCDQLRRQLHFIDDIQERVCEEIRPGVFAQWSDPFERFGLERRS